MSSEGKFNFKTDEGGITEDGFRRLVPKSKLSMYISNIIKLIILSIISVLILQNSHIAGTYEQYLRYATISLDIILVIYLIISPLIFYARYRYKISDDRIDVLKGIFTITHTIVPIERVHQVEVIRGPINNAFGLAIVNITTAGGVATIEYIEIKEAEQIADKLNEIVLRILREENE